MANLWDTFINGFPKNAKTLSYVELGDPTAPVSSIKEGEHYFRLWLAQMFLTKGQRWFVDQHPAVNAQVTVKFGGNDKVTFGRVVAPSQENFSEGVFANYPLTELMPYRGGLVELTAGLLALPGDNGWKSAVKILEKFSSLVTPPLSQTLAVAQQVSGAVGDFLGQSNGRPHLGLHETFAAVGGGGGAGFAPGYIAVVLAPSGTFAPGALLVKEKGLHVQKPGRASEPLTSHDYMLFRIEARKERDDILLKDIEGPFREACSAIAYGETKKADMCERAAIAAALLSLDLTWPDQRRVVEMIKSRLAELRGQGWGAAAAPTAGKVWEDAVKQMMRTAPSVDKAAARGRMSFEEAYSN
jgi:hypothetical protein